MTPGPDATGVALTDSIYVTFNQAMLASTFTGSTLLLKDHLNASVAATVSYDAIGVRGIINPTLDLTAGETYTVTVKSGAAGVKNLNSVAMTSDYVWSFTAIVTAPPPSLVIVGYGSATTGGGNVGDAGTTLYNPTTYAAFKTAVQASGKRIIRPAATVVINGAGETLAVNNPNMTIDGTNFRGSFKRLGLSLKSSNHILTNLRLRPGDQVAAPDDVDGLTINPGNGSSLSNIVIDHCSILWGPDVTLAILNNSTDITVQYCILGAGLFYSAHFEATPPNSHSDGTNLISIASNPNALTEYGQRITFYRNYTVLNQSRNMRAIGPDYVDWINGVVYNWGNKLAHMNPRHANAVGNMFKKGPETRASNSVAETDTDTVYATAFSNSVYWSNNIGLGFNPTTNFTAGVIRTSVAGTLSVSAATASSALADSVVAAAGPWWVDSIDQTLKDHYTNGTGNYYNGAAYAAPNPTWPPF